MAASHHQPIGHVPQNSRGISPKVYNHHRLGSSPNRPVHTISAPILAGMCHDERLAQERPTAMCIDGRRFRHTCLTEKLYVDDRGPLLEVRWKGPA